MKRRPSTSTRPVLARLRPRIRGQALVEFALVVPVFLFILLIIVDFGRLYQSWVTLNNAAREGANYAALTAQAFGTSTTAQGQYQSLISNEMTAAACQLQSDGSGNNPPYPTFPNGTNLGQLARVQLACRFTFLTPFVSNGIHVGLVDWSGFAPNFLLGASSQFPIRYGVIQ